MCPGYFTPTENIYFDMFLFPLYTKRIREREKGLFGGKEEWEEGKTNPVWGEIT